jgi:Ion channel
VLQNLFLAWALLALTVIIHAAGLALVTRRMLGSSWSPDSHFVPMTWLLVRVAWQLIVFHLIEIALWALFYWWHGCLPNFESAIYFSGVTYATVGYGDMVLPLEWRLFGPMEGLTGILMCGLSVSVFFTIFSRTFRTNGVEQRTP